ncbi:hypothetical protein ACFXPG_44730, partial [Streptomyces sp. NPDC059122]
RPDQPDRLRATINYAGHCRMTTGVHDQGSRPNLLEKFRTTLRDARARAIEERDLVTLEYVKALYVKFVSTMGESSHNRELRRPDWMHIIHSQAFANLWSKAYQAHTKGLTLVRVCGTDELHVQGDWRRVFREGRDLRRCCRSDFEGCVSNGSLDRVIAVGCGHEGRASW